MVFGWEYFGVLGSGFCGQGEGSVESSGSGGAPGVLRIGRLLSSTETP